MQINMSNYKDIHGTQIEVRSDNPSNPVNGQVWYNTTDNKLRGLASNPVGAWATGGNLNVAKYAYSGAGVSSDAGLAAGGTTSSPSPPGQLDTTEVYNGSTWTEVGDMNTARWAGAGTGTQTAALNFGGGAGPPDLKDITESWNGSTWTEVADLNTARQNLAGCGITTASLCFGGALAQSSALHERFNGTCWAEVADLNTASNGLSGFGTTTSAVAAGGNLETPRRVLNETWNGTSWTEVADLNQARFNHDGAGADATSGIVFGGVNPPPLIANTETWNGTSWTEVADLSTARQQIRGNGVATSAIGAGGQTPSVTAATEEWSEPALTIREFDLSQMARQSFLYFTPRDKPPKRNGIHSKKLNKHKKRSFKKYNKQGR